MEEHGCCTLHRRSCNIAAATTNDVKVIIVVRQMCTFFYLAFPIFSFLR